MFLINYTKTHLNAFNRHLLPNRLMSIDFLRTANGTHSSSPSAIQVAQWMIAQRPLAPPGKCSETYNEASSICWKRKIKKD